MKQVLQLKILFIGSLLLFLASCDGEDPETEIPEETVELNGVFLDSPVEGLYYETETSEGFTNAAGKFSYLEGETVTFYVGTIKLGSSVGMEEITPLSIATTQDATINSQEVKNIAAFLQTLDADGDPSNGITINQQTAEALDFEIIDFQEPITEVIGQTVNMVKQKTGIDLSPVYPEEAAIHLAESLNMEYESNDLFYNSFLPAIESWVNADEPKTASNWVHQTDEDGLVIKSVRYENHPYRISAEYEYSSYNENGLPSTANITFYDYGDPGATIQRDIMFSAEGEVEGFQNYNSENQPAIKVVITQKNDKGWIEDATLYAADDSFLHREEYILDENHNNLIKTHFNSESENEEAIEFRHTFSYNDAGEINTLSIEYFNSNYPDFTWEYTYDDNNILTEKYRETTDLHGRARTDKYLYDEDERVERLLIEVGDYISDYVAFYPNGDPKRAETTYQGFLYEIVTWDEEGYSEWKIINEDDGTYRIEYKDPSENLLKTEFFDADGNLLRTE